MITLDAVKLRIKRKKIKELAGECFVSSCEIKQKIPLLRVYSDEQFLFGFFCDEQKWTVISVRHVYFCFGREMEVLELSEDFGLIDEFYRHEGTKEKVDIELSDGRTIWLKNLALSFATHNILLMLKKLPQATVLK